MEKIEQVQEKLGQVIELANDFEDALDTLQDLKSAIMENLVECEDLVAQLYEEQEAKELPIPRKKYETVEERKQAHREAVRRYRQRQKEKMKQLEEENKKLKEEKEQKGQK